MSYPTYKIGQEIAAKDYPFYALIQAAMRQAGSDDVAKLRAVYPSVWNELQRRYNAPGGFLPGEQKVSPPAPSSDTDPGVARPRQILSYYGLKSQLISKLIHLSTGVMSRKAKCKMLWKDF